nr:MAG TPA: hypothetical protein [Caudoviricetes sp.]
MNKNIKKYTKSSFIDMLVEAASVPVLGSDVVKQNKKNNKEAVDSINKNVSEYNPTNNHSKKNNTNDVQDYNRTTLDYNFSYEPSKEYKERVKSQVHGFNSKSEEKNSNIEKDNDGLEFNGNRDFYKKNKTKKEDLSKIGLSIKKSGLASRTMKDDNFKENTMYENKIKKLKFKNTIFINEEKMLSLIPSSYKVHGKRFIMEDSNSNQYLIECEQDKVFTDVVYTNIKDYKNDTRVNEAFNRMKQLYSFKPSNDKNKTNINEDKLVGKMLDNSRNKLFE